MSESRYPYVHVDVASSEAAEASAALFALGATGLEERDASTLLDAGGADVTLIASFADEATAATAREALPERWSARIEHVVGDAWRESWKQYFKTSRVGTRIVIRPPWEPEPDDPDIILLTIDPGQAFGTGTHETTRLVLAEVERLVKGGERVLDVGCGSGILGIAALKLGATSVTSIDVDPLAEAAARENAHANDVELSASTTPVEQVRGRFDLVLANIRSPILIPMANALAARTSRDLVLSGLLTAEEAEVREVFDAHLLFRARSVEGEWLALTYGCAD